MQRNIDIELSNFYDEYNNLINGNEFINKKKYLDLIDRFKSAFERFKIIVDNNLIDDYCNKNGYDLDFMNYVIDLYNNLECNINEFNESFVNRELVSKKEYLDSILDKIDSNILLDSDQRRVVLRDEDNTLVIAGAGAGKTTTVAAKVKYLVDYKGIDPKDILIISFTNKAVNELKERINDSLGIECPITTFHATGYAILKKNDSEQYSIADNKLYFCINDYLRNNVLNNPSLVKKLLLFFSTYFYVPSKYDPVKYIMNSSGYATLKSDLNEFNVDIIDSRTKKNKTINNEIVRSYEEVVIANFLYLNNIEYKYECVYPYTISSSNKPYTPDFTIYYNDEVYYLEHFGISEDGNNDSYNKDTLEFYKKTVNNKILFHKKHNTKLLYTFSKYNDGRSLLDHLRELLVSNNIELKPKNELEVYNRLINTDNKYINKLILLISRFISNYKVNGYDSSEFERMYHMSNNPRDKLFINIANECYLDYESKLKANKLVDFEDLINESAKILNNVDSVGKKLGFKYIIVDEYQDISIQRFNLIDALKKVCDAKFIAVGDDWQSIYAFSGSKINLFTEFNNIVGYSDLIKIVRTYRNSQEVIDIAGSFIKKNDKQISKDLISNKHINNPVIIYTYDNTKKKNYDKQTEGSDYNQANALLMCLDHIVENNPNSKRILVLGRYLFDADHLEKTGLFIYKRKNNNILCYKYKDLELTFMSVHSSKGLGYDEVILLNMRNETFGFPSKIQDDPVLNYVISKDSSYEYAEERRLFYVALTRTKNRVYLLVPDNKPSEFVLELIKDNKNIVVNGSMESKIKESNRFICPHCKYPMMKTYNPYMGMTLYICTNESEICGHITNDLDYSESIQKCPDCVDGYLIVKINKDGNAFLGCTCYKEDGTGCNKQISINAINNSSKKVLISSELDDINNLIVNKEIYFKNLNYINISNIKYKDIKLDYIIYSILDLINKMSLIRFMGINSICYILKGKTNEKILKYKYNNISHFNEFNKLETKEILLIITYLIKKDYLFKTKGLYPVIHLTIKGANYNTNIDENIIKDLLKYINNNIKEDIEEI